MKTIIRVGIEFDRKTPNPFEGDAFRLFSFDAEHPNFRPLAELRSELGAVILQRKAETGAVFLLESFGDGELMRLIPTDDAEPGPNLDAADGLLIWTDPLAELGETPAARFASATRFMEEYCLWVLDECYRHEILVAEVEDDFEGDLEDMFEEEEEEEEQEEEEDEEECDLPDGVRKLASCRNLIGSRAVVHDVKCVIRGARIENLAEIQFGGDCPWLSNYTDLGELVSRPA